jgi:thioredoxin 1
MTKPLEDLATKYLPNKNVKVAKLNVDEQLATSQEYGIMSLPTFLVYVNGQDVDMVNGLVPVQKLEEAIQKALSQVQVPAKAA